jgi:hypothetical protein
MLHVQDGRNEPAREEDGIVIEIGKHNDLYINASHLTVSLSLLLSDLHMFTGSTVASID